MEIKTQRLVIRPIAESNWESIRCIREDFSRSEYAGYDRPWSMKPADVRRRIAKWAEADRDRKSLFLSGYRRT